MKASATSPDSRNNFDLIRIIASVGVIVSHSFPLWGRGPDPLQIVMNGIPIGTICVDTFFVMSGYLICQSWLSDPHPIRFLARRALRLCPALYVVLVVSVFVVGPLFTKLPVAEYWKAPATWSYLEGLGIFWIQPSLPGVFDEGMYPLAFNGPLWSIPFEVACYLTLMVVGTLGVQRSKALSVLFAVSLATAFLSTKANPDHYKSMALIHMDIPTLLRMGSLFFAGSAFYTCRLATPRLPVLAIGLAIGLVYLSHEPSFELFYHLAFPYVVLCFALTPAGWLSNSGRLGDYSYGTYLIAWPVQQAVMAAWGARLPLYGYIAVSVAITLTLAFAMWHLVEKRALRLKPRNRRTELQPLPTLAAG